MCPESLTKESSKNCQKSRSSLMDLESYVKQVECQSDCYEQSIQAIICFDSAVRFDDNTQQYLQDSFLMPGRRMSPVDDPAHAVTPDVVSQVSPSYGIVGEVKFSASSARDFRDAEAQMKKYDTDFDGWKTESGLVDSHDLSLLINAIYHRQGEAFFRGKAFSKPFSLVSCSHVKQANDVMTIEKCLGSFSDQRVDKKLSVTVAVPLESMVSQMSRVKFYDAEPPVEYTMNVLWFCVFNELAESPSAGEGNELAVNGQTITGMLRERFSFRAIDDKQPQSPRTAWINRALDAFVSIGWARKKSSGGYDITYKSYRRKDSLLDVFAKKVFESKLEKRSKNKVRQLQLL